MWKLNRDQLISYAYAFISYLLRDPKTDVSEIKNIYLFGSVARGDFDKESDVDIFIDTSENLKKNIKRALKKFYNSKEAKKFKMHNVNNEINLMHGKLKEWELKETIEKSGLLLYSQTPTPNLKGYFIVTIQPIKNVTKRNRVIRKLFGREEKNYKKEGLVDELGGEILDTRVFTIPAEKINKILEILSKEKIEYSTKKIWK